MKTDEDIVLRVWIRNSVPHTLLERNKISRCIVGRVTNLITWKLEPRQKDIRTRARVCVYNVYKAYKRNKHGSRELRLIR